MDKIKLTNEERDKDKAVWDVWENNLKKYDEPFMAEREQPECHQDREGLDELFD